MAAALGSTMLFAGVSIADKVVLSRFNLRLTSFRLFAGLGALAYAVGIFAFTGVPSLPALTVLQTVSSGALWGAGLVFMFWMLSRDEVSRVIPVFQSYPIFVAVAAVFLLDEQLGLVNWMAVLLTVGGAALVSMNPAEAGRGFRFRAGFPFLLVGAGLAAGSQLVLKTVTDDVSFWDVVALRSVGLFLVLGLPGLRPNVIRDLITYLKVPHRAAPLVGAETIGAGLGNILLIFAVANGPVSLASAVLGTRPLFVFMFSLLLAWKASWLLAENLTRGEVILKLTSTVMVVCGLALIAVRF
ncbi:MAG: EamA family transporter [Dehalococcoidia bacterium]